MEATKPRAQKLGLTSKIFIAMITGIAVGIILYSVPTPNAVNFYIIDGLLDIGGKVFITILKMLVVPIVFVSLVCGVCNIGSGERFGWLALKTMLLYIITTAFAISLALLVASLFHIGAGSDLVTNTKFIPKAIPSLKETFLNIFPENPVAALARGNMLQVIVFSILLGLAIALSGEKGQRIRDFFSDFNEVIMKLMTMVIKLAPYGVFCLVATIFAKMGFDLVFQLFGYFSTVLLVLFLQLLLVYPTILTLLSGLNPLPFFKKLFPAMMFAFSTSSSSASIPVVLEIVELKLGVKNFVAAFVIPLGATINMDGTAIMQGVATVFIANSYNIHIGMTGYLMVVLTATLASIGTAGIPSVGLITLTMVLQQVGLPIEGIALIIGVDRLLDMVRTAVNVTGDSTIACVVAKSESAIDMDMYNDTHLPEKY